MMMLIMMPKNENDDWGRALRLQEVPMCETFQGSEVAACFYLAKAESSKGTDLLL